MRIKNPGRINERLWFLGREDSCVYLLEGDNSSLLINGGLSSLLPEILEQFDTFRIDRSRIDKYLVLHSHFDHVGLVPYFLHSQINLTLYASPRSLEVFQKEKVVAAINAASLYDLRNRGREQLLAAHDLAWQVGFGGEAVTDGDRINLGGVEVEIYATPGHSPCSISAYVPGMQALFPSDAGGIPCAEKIATYGTSNYTHYEESLRKLSGLDARLLCADHSGYVCGAEAAGYNKATLAEAVFRRELMLEMLQKTGSVSQAAELLASRYRDENVGNMVPFETLVAAYAQMIKHVADV